MTSNPISKPNLFSIVFTHARHLSRHAIHYSTTGASVGRLQSTSCVGAFANSQVTGDGYNSRIDPVTDQGLKRLDRTTIATTASAIDKVGKSLPVLPSFFFIDRCNGSRICGGIHGDSVALVGFCSFYTLYMPDVLRNRLWMIVDASIH